MIQSGKSLLKFDCWSNKVFKKYEDLFQIMMSLFFVHINPRSITRSIMRWIRNVKSNRISYSWYFLKVIYFKNNLIWPFQLLVPRLYSFLYLVYSRGQHCPTRADSLRHLFQYFSLLIILTLSHKGRWFPFSFHIWSAIPDFSIFPCTTSFQCSCSLTFR